MPCILGRKETYQRRIPHSNCYSGRDYERPIKIEVCECDAEDFDWFVILRTLRIVNWKSLCFSSNLSLFFLVILGLSAVSLRSIASGINHSISIRIKYRKPARQEVFIIGHVVIEKSPEMYARMERKLFICLRLYLVR